MTVQADKDWLVVQSTYPSDSADWPIEAIVSVNRTLMKPGRNTAEIRVRDGSHDERRIVVMADAIVSAELSASAVKAAVGEPITFSDMTRVLTGADPVIRWEWSFGDGTTSTERNPVHVYSQPGLYTVSLAVNSATISDVRIRPNYIEVVRPPEPVPDFMAATRTPAIGDPVQFVDLSISGAGEITSWIWDFGDGGTSTLRNPVHVYTAAAVYDVYLTISTNLGTKLEAKLGYMDVGAREQ